MALLLAPGLVAVASAEDLFGNAFANVDLVRIDSDTGAGVSVGNLGLGSFNSMELVGDTFYGYRGVNGMYTWTLAAPTAVAVGGADDVRGLAWDGSVMWGVREMAGSTDQLVTVNLDTGATTLVGATGFSSIQALAVDATGLYAWDITQGLLTVNSGSGAATDVNPNAPGNPNIQGLTFGVGGQLYGARNELYSISAGTGVVTLVGSGGYSDIRGLAGNLVPEPSTFVALLFGGLLLAAGRRKR
jgi:hypothetical protein